MSQLSDLLIHGSLFQADKHEITQQLGVQLRDLRLLDPQLHASYPSALLCRDKALVVNLEHIKCIITKDEVLVLNADEESVVSMHLRSMVQHTDCKPEYCFSSPGTAFHVHLSRVLGVHRDGLNTFGAFHAMFCGRVSAGHVIPCSLLCKRASCL